MTIPSSRLSGLLPAALAILQACAPPSPGTGMTFHVTLDASVVDSVAALGLETPITGRLFVVVSNHGEREPRQQVGVSGVPFWGRDVEGLRGGDAVTIAAGDPTVAGFALDTPADLPPGQYFAQAFLSVYTTFRRADGHVLKMHLNAGEGQNLWRAPGNVYGEPVAITVDPARQGRIELALDRMIPPIEPLGAGEVLQQGNPRNAGLVRFVKMRSERLSAFWGRDMYLGANVLLPADYDVHPDRRYPVIYSQGHFPGRRAPFGYSDADPDDGRGRGREFSEWWRSGSPPRMIAISFRDANPYYDTSYSVNSENVGPYGDAITLELIPHLESRFRIIAEPWARVVAGGSTGGWEALAMQIHYPDTFGGAWGWCPDPVDFRYYQIVNVYEDDNAYWTGSEWHRIERPNTRRPDGNVTSTVLQENRLEYASGPDTRSGGQWAIWEAVFGPVGENGYPRPIWDPVSGEIDHETAEYWRRNHDLREVLAANWESVGRKLDGKLHIAVGDMDTYYLDNAVYLLDDFLKSATAPRIAYEVQYGRRKPHCWTGYSPSGSGEDMTNQEFVGIVAAHLRANAPAGAPMDWLRP